LNPSNKTQKEKFKGLVGNKTSQTLSMLKEAFTRIITHTFLLYIVKGGKFRCNQPLYTGPIAIAVGYNS